MPPPIIRFWLVLLLLTMYAWRRGGAPEKTMAAVFAVGAIISHLAAKSTANERFGSHDLGLMFVDVAVLIATVAVALKANRLWPIPVASLQLISVLGHVGSVLDPTARSLGYAMMSIAPVYPMMFLLGLGTSRHTGRLRRFGVDKPWRIFSHR